MEKHPDVLLFCKSAGTHLTSCDDDGYCNYCGYQDCDEWDD